MRRKKGVTPPYRSNLLTRLLAESFVRADAELRVIATVSPCATDLEHSLATLRTAFSLSGRPESRVEETKVELVREKKARLTPPRRWTAPQVQSWLGSISGGEFADVKVPSTLDGQAFVRWPEARFVQLCGNRGARLYRLLHDEMAKVDASSKEPPEKTILADWRARRRSPVEVRGRSPTH
jgi:hypothetical protein